MGDWEIEAALRAGDNYDSQQRIAELEAKVLVMGEEIAAAWSVADIETNKVERLEQENARLRGAIQASQNGTICPLCNSMPHNDSCPALNGEMGDDL